MYLTFCVIVLKLFVLHDSSQLDTYCKIKWQKTDPDRLSTKRCKQSWIKYIYLSSGGMFVYWPVFFAFLFSEQPKVKKKICNSTLRVTTTMSDIKRMNPTDTSIILLTVQQGWGTPCLWAVCGMFFFFFFYVRDQRKAADKQILTVSHSWL